MVYIIYIHKNNCFVCSDIYIEYATTSADYKHEKIKINKVMKRPSVSFLEGLIIILYHSKLKFIFLYSYREVNRIWCCLIMKWDA